jgi:ribosomal-protein-serine acetyltransferase
MLPARAPICTTRLTLDPVDHRHDDELLSSVRSSVQELEPWMPWAASLSPALQQAYAERAIRDWEAGREYHFAMVQDGHAIGVIGMNVRRPGEGEIHYWIRSDRAGRGLTTEAARSVLEFAFSTLGLERVLLMAGRRNSPSLRIAEKLGFVRDGDLEGGMEGGRGRFEAYRHHLDIDGIHPPSETAAGR